MVFTVKIQGSEGRGSEKGVSRRCLERPLGEYAPLGVHPRIGTRETGFCMNSGCPALHQRISFCETREVG